MLGSVSNYENYVFFAGQQLRGIENFNISYSNQSNVSRFIGFSKGHTLPLADSEKQFSFSRYLIYKDPILTLTGSSPIRGSINYNGLYYGFESGFLTEYGVNCAIGSIPVSNAKFSVYGPMNSDINHVGSQSTPMILIPDQSSIFISCDNSSTNRVVGFDYSLKINREPIYKIGSINPAEVIIDNVLEFNASVQIDVDNAFLHNAAEFLSARQNKTVTLTIKSKDQTQTIQEFSMPNASLVGETLESSADGSLKLTLNYIGHS